MQPNTEVGVNRTGMALEPDAAAKMLENIDLTKPPKGDEQAMAKMRGQYIAEAEPVGTIPDGNGMDATFTDKLGERLAFERAGTRLYDALLAKCRATPDCGLDIEEVQEHRDEEAEHFALVGAAIQSLGGDPTAQTPSADVSGVEGAGLMQVLTDPKTTVAQALHAILVAEMTDNAGWEELIDLARTAGAKDLVGRFEQALDTEREHLEEVRAWYRSLSGK
jgi:ferritin-like protein